jgi:hypothetical protein
MPLLENEPPFNPEPLTGVQYKAAFLSFFEAVSVIAPSESNGEMANSSLLTAHDSAHQIATRGTYFCASAIQAAKAYEGYLFKDVDPPEQLRKPVVSHADLMAYKKTMSEEILAPVIMAYAFSGLAIADGSAMVNAAANYRRDSYWVERKIREGRAHILTQINKKLPDTPLPPIKERRAEKRYVKALATTALDRLMFVQSPIMSREQLQALEEAQVDPLRFKASFKPENAASLRRRRK